MRAILEAGPLAPPIDRSYPDVKSRHPLYKATGGSKLTQKCRHRGDRPDQPEAPAFEGARIGFRPEWGSHSSAQGNALGTGLPKDPCPEGAPHGVRSAACVAGPRIAVPSRSLGRPDRALSRGSAGVPRALPWAFVLRPLRGEGRTAPLHFQTDASGW